MIITSHQEKSGLTHLINSYQRDYTFIEINKSAINHNIQYYKNYIGNNNKLAIVIKGNGYGHGLVTIGLIIQENKEVDFICVAHYAEALSLINAGITKDILVLGYASIEADFHLFNTIHFMVDTIEYAMHLNTIGKSHRHQFNIHIKIDTGLSRLGIQPNSATHFIQQLKQLPYIKINGIFSHFIASDSNDAVTQKQLKTFSHAIDSLVCSNTTIDYIHMSNTASITTLNYPDFYNFFRIGLGIYGFSNHINDLKPALTWKTHVIAIKKIPTNSYVSYACTYKTIRPTTIALLPVGYSDGYQLRFSNKTSVLINNTITPVIGRVGMNISIIDVTDCNATVDDEVILLGDAPNIRVTDIAQATDIYNVREIFTGINPSIQRIITL